MQGHDTSEQDKRGGGLGGIETSMEDFQGIDYEAGLAGGIRARWGRATTRTSWHL